MQTLALNVVCNFKIFKKTTILIRIESTRHSISQNILKWKNFKYILKVVLISSIFMLSSSLKAQNNVGLKFFGLSFHPKGEHENAFLMPNKLDKNGYLVMNFGAVVSYEHFIFKEIISLKVAQALYSDCAARLGGFSHIGLRGRILKKGKHTLLGGIGPTIIYRKNWVELNGYENKNRFKGEIYDKWQYMFIWYGGEFEYRYSISENMDITSSFVPGYPDLMSLSFGINIKIKNKLHTTIDKK